MKRSVIVLGIAFGAVASAPSAQTGTSSSPTDQCLAQARARAADAYQTQHSPDAARRQLEIDAALCLDPTLSPAAANLIGTVNADYARLAHDFVDGSLSLAAYRAARNDRRRKLAAMQADPAQQQALLDGDADGDLVPDSRDKCPNTPPDAPTDARGCPVRVRPGANDVRDERSLRATLATSRTLFNKSCDGAPRPDIPAPLEWGRGAQTRFGTAGFNLAIAKISGQPAGCEVFYEIQIRFIDANPGNPALPPAKIITLVFSASEDLLADPVRAVFGLPVGGAALTPARDNAQEAFNRQYFRAMWRVRAVNGANRSSPWSAFVTQGPAGGGVPG